MEQKTVMEAFYELQRSVEKLEKALDSDWRDMLGEKEDE